MHMVSFVRMKWRIGFVFTKLAHLSGNFLANRDTFASVIMPDGAMRRSFPWLQFDGAELRDEDFFKQAEDDVYSVFCRFRSGWWPTRTFDASSPFPEPAPSEWIVGEE